MCQRWTGLLSTLAYDRPNMPAFTHQLYMIANVHTQLANGQTSMMHFKINLHVHVLLLLTYIQRSS